MWEHGNFWSYIYILTVIDTSIEKCNIITNMTNVGINRKGVTYLIHTSLQPDTYFFTL